MRLKVVINTLFKLISKHPFYLEIFKSSFILENWNEVGNAWITKFYAPVSICSLKSRKLSTRDKVHINEEIRPRKQVLKNPSIIFLLSWERQICLKKIWDTFSYVELLIVWFRRRELFHIEQMNKLNLK